jgi:hypothetical protein
MAVIHARSGLFVAILPLWRRLLVGIVPTVRTVVVLLVHVLLGRLSSHLSVVAPARRLICCMLIVSHSRGDFAKVDRRERSRRRRERMRKRTAAAATSDDDDDERRRR